MPNEASSYGEIDVEGDELEAALRREGYRLSRRELDAMMEEHEYQLFKARVARYASEVGAEPALAAADEDDDEDGEQPKKRALPRTSGKKPAAEKPAPAQEPDEEEADWV